MSHFINGRLLTSSSTLFEPARAAYPFSYDRTGKAEQDRQRSVFTVGR
jgi:hypothetical protein